MERKNGSLTTSVFVLACAALTAWYIQSARLSGAVAAAMPVLPSKIGEWSLLRTVAIPDEFLKILGTKTASLGEYAGNDGKIIQVYILQTSGRRSTIHQPEYCYLGSGKNELLKRGTVGVELPDKRTVPLNYLLLQTERGFEAVLYCYTVGNIVTDSYYRQQFLFLLNGLKNKKVVGSLIRISKNYQSENNAKDLSELQLFANKLLKEKVLSK